MASTGAGRIVTVLGAAGGIGQPLSLLLKLNPRVAELRLYDIRGGAGVAADLSHIDTLSEVNGYNPDDAGLQTALKDAEVVVIPAGVPRKPGMTRDDLFNTNASIVRDLAKATAEACPKAMLCVISNPVNSMVPIVAQVYKSKGVYDPKRLFGVTTLDLVRAAKFLSEIQKTDPKENAVPVVGGHSGVTIVPLLSKAGYIKTGKERDKLVNRIQFGGDEVVKAKDGAGSATLSMAHAGAKFTDDILSALEGKKSVNTYAFVDSPLYKDQGIDFFSSKLELGPEGVEKIHKIDEIPKVGKVDKDEQELIDACLPELKTNIQKGVSFIESNPGK